MDRGFRARWRTPWGGNSGGNGATVTVLPLERTDVPGVYRRGSKFVVVYRVGGRQRKQSADTLARGARDQARRDGEARARRRGPTLHEFSLAWLDRYAGSGHDSVRENTRREYRRLLVNFALTLLRSRGPGARPGPRRACSSSSTG